MPTPPTWLLPLLTLILLWGMPSTASSQTCEHDARIAELRAEISTPPADAYERLVYALALTLEKQCVVINQRDAALGERNDARTDRDRQAMRGDLLEKQNAELQRKLDAANHPKISDSWAPPLWLVIPLRAVAVGATSAAAYSLARGLPPELIVGFAVGGLGALVVDVVLTLVTRPR